MSNYNFQSYSAQFTSYDEKPNVFYSHGATRSGHCDRRLFHQYVYLTSNAHCFQWSEWKVNHRYVGLYWAVRLICTFSSVHYSA